MSLGSKLSSDILTTMLFKMSLKIRGLVFIPLLTITLSVSDYGAFVQVNSVASLIALFCLLGYDSGFVRYIHNTESESRLFTSLTIIAFITSTIGGVVVVGVASLLAQYTLQSTEYTTLFVFGGAYVVVHSMFQLARSFHRANRQIKFYSFTEALDVYLSVGFVATVVLLFNGTVEHAFLALTLVHAVVTALLFANIAYHGGFSHPSWSHIIECTRFSVGAMGNIVAGTLLHKIDRVLIGFFLGAGAVGVYSAAYSIAQLIKLFYQPINISFFPEFSKLWTEGRHHSIRQYMQLGIRYAAIIGIPSIAGFALIGENILGLLSTSDVASAGLVPLVLIAAGLLVRGIGTFYSQLFYAKGTSRIPFLVQVSTVALNTGLNWLLIPIWGITGAALTTLISFSVAAIIIALLWQREERLTPHWGEIGQMLLAAGCMMLVYAFVDLPWLAILVTAPIIYFGVLAGIGGIRKQERQSIIQAVR